MIANFKVSAMTCNHCVNKIKQFVGEIEGVTNIDINLDTKIIKVDFNAPASIDLIKEAILDSGFEFELA